MAGRFKLIGGVERSAMAAIDRFGKLKDWDAKFDGETNDGLYVTSIEIVDDTVYIGGTFSYAQGKRRSGAAAITAGGLLTEWDPSTSSKGDDGMGIDAIVYDKGSLYIGGSFRVINGQKHPGIAIVDLFKGNPTSWKPAIKGTVRAIIPAASSVFIGGKFEMADNNIRTSLAEINLSDAKPTDFKANVKGTVLSLAVFGKDLLIGGVIDKVADTAVENFAVIDLKESKLVPTEVAVNGWLQSIAISGNSIILGGSFTKVNAAARGFLAMLDANYQLSDWRTETRSYSSGPGVAEVLPAGSQLIVGGGFTSINGSDMYLARITDPA